MPDQFDNRPSPAELNYINEIVSVAIEEAGGDQNEALLHLALALLRTKVRLHLVTSRSGAGFRRRGLRSTRPLKQQVPPVDSEPKPETAPAGDDDDGLAESDD